jgi:peroxiredoxin
MDNVNVLRTGFYALDFALPDTNGDIYKLSDHLKDIFVAVCFFPNGDNEKVNAYLKDLNQGLPNSASGLPVSVVGICPRRVDDLKKFKEKLKLGFPILSDHLMTVCSKYHTVESNSAKPSVYFSIFVIDDYSFIRYRAGEVPGLSKYSPEEFRTAVAKIV